MKILQYIVAVAAILSSVMANAQNTIYITANGRTMTATLADSDAARELLTKLVNGPVTVNMNDYGGFEKVGDLPWALSASDRQTTTSAGDIMLYQGHSIVIFYGSNSWAYTPLGRIDNASASEIRDFLSGSSIPVTFSATNVSGVDNIPADNGNEPVIYSLSGHKISLGNREFSSLPKGLYIVNGKKKLIK